MALSGEGLCFGYSKGQKQILSDFCVSFPAGQITALTGANGCGKTTLTKLLVGILKTTQGKVWLDDTDISTLSLAEIGHQVGYVMQNPAQQICCTSVEEEIAYGLKNMNLSELEIESRISYYLAYFELGQYRKSFPFHLSQGEKQRLVLAAILAMKPKYLILDEPTASLDMYCCRLLGELLRKIVVEEGCGIVLVSHDANFVKQYADAQIEMMVVTS